MVKLTKDLEKILEESFEDEWERVYYMDGIGLSDFLNPILPEGVKAGATRYGEEIFFYTEEDGFEQVFYEWGRWDKWREYVSDLWSGWEDVVREAVENMDAPTEKSIQNLVEQYADGLVYNIIGFIFGDRFRDLGLEVPYMEKASEYMGGVYFLG